MLRIRGGTVYDPANNVNGEVRDVCVSGGRVVADVAAGTRTIDASGMVVFPGGVDVHTHIGVPDGRGGAAEEAVVEWTHPMGGSRWKSSYSS